MADAENPNNLRQSIAGKVAVVTGGGRGVGRETALQLARAGARVVVVARTGSEIDETVEQINKDGGRGLAFPADISDWAANRRLADRVRQVFGTPDILVPNASIIDPMGNSWEVEPEAWAHSVNVNLVGAFFAVRAFLPEMVKRGEGRVILISTGAATHAAPGWSAYCAAKAGMVSFAQNLAAELDHLGSAIRVFTLFPGIVDTPMQEKIRGMPPDTFPDVKKYLGYYEKGWLRPAAEPASAIVWLASCPLPDLHGQVVKLDDVAVRRRLAVDLGIPMFKGRGE